MGLFNVFSWFGSSRGTVVVDASDLLEAQGVKRAVPRDQLRILRRLSRYAKKEQVEVIAVLQGKPLRKAPDRKKFEGVSVRYAANRDKVIKLILSLSKKGKAAVVISGSEDVEKKVIGKGSCMRSSTFMKAFEGDGEGSSRPPKKRPARNKQQRKEKPAVDEQPVAEKESTENSEEELINELIDLV
ncbi:hypothetical protein ACFLQY_04995 [Verrucomicrobiota bacterium]